MPRKSSRMSVARVYLDSGGYERGGGRYFGHDREDVYRLSVDGDGYRYFRARDRKDALAKAKKITEREGTRFLGAYNPRGRRRDEESHIGAYLLLGGCVLVAGVGLYAAVKA